jgi:6-phosphogluconolactonase
MKSLPLLACLTCTVLAHGADSMLYVGSYTGDGSKSEGITLLKFSESDGAISVVGTAAKTPSPSFLAWHPTSNVLYAVNESTSAASAYRRDQTTGMLQALATHPVGPTENQAGCHLVVAPQANILVTAQYSGGSVSVFPITENGDLAPRSQFIKHEPLTIDGKITQPRGHSTTLAPDGKSVLVNDLGNDRIYVYAIDAKTRKLGEPARSFATLATGAGPRHGAFSPNGSVYYCLNEINSTITSFTWNADQMALTSTTTIPTLPPDFTGKNSTAEICVSSDGKFVYASNRGHDSIVVGRVDDAATGALTPIQHHPSGGKTPRNFTLSPSGRWLLAAHQGTDNVVVHAVDPSTGKLTMTPHAVTVGKPVCLLFARP